MSGRAAGMVYLLVIVALLAPAALAAQDAASEALLKSKGLTRSGILYLLDGDLNLRAGLRTMRQARGQLDSALARRTEIEHQIRDARDAQIQLYSEQQAISEQMKKSKNIPLRYNDLVNQINAVRGRIAQADQFIEEREKALKAFSIPMDPYIKAVKVLAEQMDATQKQYEALAADPDVRAALARLNTETRVPLKLGPSEQFTTELKSVRQEREKVRAAAVKFDLDGGVPFVKVVLNGTLPWKMVLDSGAAEVELTHAVARELGLTPEASDPVMRVRTADGKITKARIKTLKSIRLAQFEVENVECVVMPEGVECDNLLGGTFLSHFVYQMDLNAGEIRLSQIGPPPKPEAVTGTTDPLASGSASGPTSPQAPPVPRPGAAGTPGAGSGAGQWVDLLQAVDVKRDAIGGAWSMSEGRLTVEAGGRPAKLHFPRVHGNSYDLHVEYESPDPPKPACGITVCIPVGRNPACVSVQPDALGLEMIDGARFDHNATTRHGDFGAGNKHSIDISVWAAETDARVRVAFDGARQFDWSGPVTELQSEQTWEMPEGFGIGSWMERFVITAVRLRDGADTAWTREAPTVRMTLPASPTTQPAAATIPGSATWTPTALHVEQGHCYRLVATGTWNDRNGHPSGPEGGCPPECFQLLGPPATLTAQQKAAYYVSQDPIGALVCRIGEQKWGFYVGSECRFIAPCSGPLAFRMNGGGKTPSGECVVTLSPFEPQWVRPDGTIEVTARLDLKDMLHLTPQGPYWEWDGVGGRLGGCGGYYPTIINGVYWWPRWVTRRTSNPLPAPALWPSDPAKARILKVNSPTAVVDLLGATADDVSIAYMKGTGSGCSQIGVVLQVR